MILAAIFDLEVLRWQPRFAVAMPHPIGEQAFQRYLLNVFGLDSTSEASFAAPFEHCLLADRQLSSHSFRLPEQMAEENQHEVIKMMG